MPFSFSRMLFVLTFSSVCSASHASSQWIKDYVCATRAQIQEELQTEDSFFISMKYNSATYSNKIFKDTYPTIYDFLHAFNAQPHRIVVFKIAELGSQEIKQTRQIEENTIEIQKLKKIFSVKKEEENYKKLIEILEKQEAAYDSLNVNYPSQIHFMDNMFETFKSWPESSRNDEENKKYIEYLKKEKQSILEKTPKLNQNIENNRKDKSNLQNEYFAFIKEEKQKLAQENAKLQEELEQKTMRSQMSSLTKQQEYEAKIDELNRLLEEKTLRSESHKSQIGKQLNKTDESIYPDEVDFSKNPLYEKFLLMSQKNPEFLEQLSNLKIEENQQKEDKSEKSFSVIEELKELSKSVV